MLVENKLVKLIGRTFRDIVNITDTCFWYANGYFAIKCTYSNHRVISKLFESGALSDYKDWKAKYSFDLSEVLKFDESNLYDAVFTGFYKKAVFKKDTIRVMKNTFNNNFCLFDESYLDIFGDCDFKFQGDDSYKMYAFESGELIGVVLGIRDEEKEETQVLMSEMMKEAESDVKS